MNRPSPVGMMLQFALGPRPATAKPSTGRAAHADGTAARDVSPQVPALVAASKAWWESRRPQDWTQEQHLANPIAGCDGTEEEQALAKAVAAWLGQSS